ncbi:hypothetical protein RHMOL_Rhmol05G0252300 [Rhododendron molle]|uniref:Uncharacterized protein n=1 Tax=Rhododendron molle TaxID=49168 RepID=A0ACC0NT34_RHOML|nr:hypothetical protein RHMOL_Rhmol05G0252300 [Rhododendron molle]
MSIPTLVAGFIKYGERTWVLLSVSGDKSGKIVPFGYVDSDSNLGNNYTSEDKNYIRDLCIAHRCVRVFKEFTEYYDMGNNWFGLRNRIELEDISQFWKVIEVEMGLMFDLLYTKASINFSKRGCIMRCIAFSSTVAVLVGLIIRLGEGREKWHKVDIAITEVLLVGALALEIYAIISLTIEGDPSSKEFFDRSFQEQIFNLHFATEICYNLEMEWDTDDAADQNNRDGTVSQQHTTPPSDSSLSWEGHRELCRTLSHYMMYLLFMRSSLLPIAASHDFFRGKLREFEKDEFGDAQDVRAACRYLFETDSDIKSIVELLLKSKQKDLRWETLKWVWVRMLCHAASKGHINEHFRQLSQGGEFLTFLWFFLPHSKMLRILP